MLELVRNLLSSSQYIPHGHCYLWQTPLVWLHLISDALIAIAYFSIPAMLIYFVRQRGDIPFSNVFKLFGAFIILCGAGHLLDIWTLWHADYWVSGAVRALTALVSCYTALTLVELLPQFLALKTPEHLEFLNRELEKQVAERQQTEETLQMIVGGTASVTGQEFFPALVQNLGTALDVAYVIVSEKANDSLTSLRSRAIWAGDRLAENMEYSLVGAPCAHVIADKQLHNYPSALQTCFPNNPLLQALQAESYMGLPLLDAQQAVIGNLCIIDTKPFLPNERTQVLMRVFAARAATEMQRQWAEDEKRRAYEDLEVRVAARTAELLTANAALESEIRERVGTAVALQQSQEQFSKAFHSNPIACCISTLKGGRFVDVNTSFLSLFGYRREEIVGKTSAELQIWANALDRDRLIHALQQQQSVQMDVPFTIRSGEAREGMASFEQIELQGEPCLLSMIYDVTERKQAEAEQVQQMRLAALRADVGTALTEGTSLSAMLNCCAIALHEHLDAAFARIWILNEAEQMLILHASAGLYTQLNGTHSRIPVGQFKIGWIAQHRQPHLTNQVLSDPQVSDPAWAQREGLVAFAGYPLMIQNRLLGVVALFARQPLPERTLRELAAVTNAIAVGIDRKLTEVALRRTAKRDRAVARMVQRMRETLDLETIFRTTTEELLQVIEGDRTLIYRFNPDWSGQVVAEAVAAGWDTVIPLRRQEPELTQDATNQANCIVKRLDGSEVLIQDTYLQENEGGPYRHGINYCCVADIYQAGFDACYLELLESLQARAYITAPIFCGSQLWGLLCTYQNTGPREWQDTEIQMVMQIGSQLGVAVQQAELLVQTQEQAKQLSHAKDAADAANRAKSEFLANMSHELRTPLNVILGLTQLMNRDQALTPEHQRYLETIGSSGEHLLGLINDVLEMSKIEAGMLTFHQGSFNLHHLLNNLRDMLHFRATSKGLQFSVESDPNLPPVIRTDEGKLRQILINLLGNAIKFTARGAVTLRAKVDSPVTLRFEVEDTGPGIAPDELKQLFRAFAQTRAGMTATEGTGLGLAISQKYAQMMGSGIAVQSQVGQGSLFSFGIAAEPDQTAIAAPNLAIAGKVVGLAPNQPTYRILIAEDNPTNRLLLTKLLDRIGFELQEAANGQEAIDRWQTWHPDLIFMDMRMPILNGQEAVQQLRALEAQQSGQGRTRTKIIALTASAFSEQRAEMMAAGCDDFIYKPFKIQEVFEKIAHHLNVEYRYTAPLGNTQQQVLQAEGDQTLKAAMLQVMPPAWIEQLHRAAVHGNDLEILQLTAAIPAAQAPLAKTLKRLADNFQFDQIIDVTAPS